MQLTLKPSAGLAFILGAAALALSACGGGDNNNTPLSPLTVVPDDNVQALSGSGGGGGGGSGGGGSGGGVVVNPPATCVAQISSFSNTAGYGPYGPSVADIRTRFTVKNCTGSAVTWQAKLVYHGPFWGGTVFDFPLTCAMNIAANSSTTCQVTERYLLIMQSYDVTLDILDAGGNSLAKAAATVATPTVPNPNAT